MTNIEKNDVVGLTRDLDSNLPEGLVGVVTERHEDGLDVKFPVQGSETQHARVAPEDVKFIASNDPLSSEKTIG